VTVTVTVDIKIFVPHGCRGFIGLCKILSDAVKRRLTWFCNGFIDIIDKIFGKMRMGLNLSSQL